MRLRKVCVVVRICMHVCRYKGFIDYTNSTLPKFPRANAVNKHEKLVRHLGGNCRRKLTHLEAQAPLGQEVLLEALCPKTNGMIQMAASE